jgi:hypothetical protein
MVIDYLKANPHLRQDNLPEHQEIKEVLLGMREAVKREIVDEQTIWFDH